MKQFSTKAVEHICNTIMVLALLAAMTYCHTAKADIVCRGVSSGLKKRIVVVIDELSEKAHVMLPDDEIGEVHSISSSYDGHMTGLITARGFSMKYESIYGCYKNVVIVTNVRYTGGVGYIDTINIKSCSGGTTSDDMCNR